MDLLCGKCGNVGSVILRRKDAYCHDCFIVNINHKFRSSLGKNKLMKSQQKVLLGISGGWGSTVMLDIVSNSMKLETHKKLRIEAVCIHIVGANKGDLPDQHRIAQEVINQCEEYGFQVYIVHLSDFENGDLVLDLPNYISQNKNKPNNLHENIEKMTSTARNDYFAKLKRKIFIKCAEKLNCKYIFTAETAVALAANMLSNIVVGRGQQVQNDVGFCDSRNDLYILRPMKDITFEEIKYYVSIKKLTTANIVSNCTDISLQTAIKSFVVDLQENYPATISTVCKTADKIGGQVENDKTELANVCAICESSLQHVGTKLTALEATNFSSIISNNPQYVKNESDFIENSIHLENMSFNDESLCHGCSRTCSEIKDINNINVFSVQHIK